jgi:hypothetical protein
LLPIEELMATLTEPVAPVSTVECRGRGTVALSCLTTTDRKSIGHLCLITSFGFFLIAVPTGVKFFNWIGTMWRGSLSFEPPMLWALGFLVTWTLFVGLHTTFLVQHRLDAEGHKGDRP